MDGINITNLKNFNIRKGTIIAFLISVFGPVQFVILTLIAMFTFPRPYQFFGDFFSTLGLTVIENGTPNDVSSFLFILALTLATISLIPIWILLWKNFQLTRLETLFSTCGSYLGLLCAPCLTLIGLFPADIELNAHILVTTLFFLFTALGIMFYTFIMFLRNDYHKIYAFTGLSLTIFILLFIFGTFRDFNPLAQKIAVYGMVIWALIQMIGLWKKELQKSNSIN